MCWYLLANDKLWGSFRESANYSGDLNTERWKVSIIWILNKLFGFQMIGSISVFSFQMIGSFQCSVFKWLGLELDIWIANHLNTEQLFVRFSDEFGFQVFGIQIPIVYQPQIYVGFFSGGGGNFLWFSKGADRVCACKFPKNTPKATQNLQKDPQNTWNLGVMGVSPLFCLLGTPMQKVQWGSEYQTSSVFG
jgi:hypothetical protein